MKLTESIWSVGLLQGLFECVTQIECTMTVESNLELYHRRHYLTPESRPQAQQCDHCDWRLWNIPFDINQGRVIRHQMEEKQTETGMDYSPFCFPFQIVLPWCALLNTTQHLSSTYCTVLSMAHSHNGSETQNNALRFVCQLHSAQAIIGVQQYRMFATLKHKWKKKNTIKFHLPVPFPKWLVSPYTQLRLRATTAHFLDMHFRMRSGANNNNKNNNRKYSALIPVNKRCLWTGTM